MQYIIKVRSFTDYLIATRILNGKSQKPETFWQQLDRSFSSANPPYDALSIETTKSDWGIKAVDCDQVFPPHIKEITLKQLSNLERFIETIEKTKGIPNTPIEELELSVRLYNCLKYGIRINSLPEIFEYTAEELMKTRNFGQRTLTELEQVLGEMGLSLSEGKK